MTVAVADFAPAIQAVAAGIAVVLTTLIGILVPKAITAFETRTGIQLTDQQQSQVMAAAQTAAGLLETKMDQGALKLEDVSPAHPAVMLAAMTALSRLPDEAMAGMAKHPVPQVAMADTIVGLMNTRTVGAQQVHLIVPPSVPAAPAKTDDATPPPATTAAVVPLGVPT